MKTNLSPILILIFFVSSLENKYYSTFCVANILCAFYYTTTSTVFQAMHWAWPSLFYSIHLWNLGKKSEIIHFLSSPLQQFNFTQMNVITCIQSTLRGLFNVALKKGPKSKIYHLKGQEQSLLSGKMLKTNIAAIICTL